MKLKEGERKNWKEGGKRRGGGAKEKKETRK